VGLGILSFDDHEMAHVAQMRPDLVDERLEIAMVAEHGGSAMVEDIGDLLGGQTDVDRREHTAGLQDPVIPFQQMVRVIADECDPLPGR